MTVGQIRWVLGNMIQDRENLSKTTKQLKKQKSKVYSALGES